VIRNNKKDKLVEYLTRHGLVEYRKGCFAKADPGLKIPNKFKRLHLMNKVVRFEVFHVTEQTYGPDTRRWSLVRSSYYGEIVFDEAGDVTSPAFLVLKKKVKG